LDAKVGGTYKMSFTNFTTGKSHSFGGTVAVPSLSPRPHAGDPDLAAKCTQAGVDRYLVMKRVVMRSRANCSYRLAGPSDRSGVATRVIAKIFSVTDLIPDTMT